MTAKEALRELVDDLPEDEAALWLERMRMGQSSNDRPVRPIWEVIREIMADVPDEVLATIPSSDRIDEIVYGAAPEPE